MLIYTYISHIVYYLSLTNLTYTLHYIHIYIHIYNIATSFNIWLKPENNFTKNMSRSMFIELRKLIIELVLATGNIYYIVMLVYVYKYIIYTVCNSYMHLS